MATPAREMDADLYRDGTQAAIVRSNRIKERFYDEFIFFVRYISKEVLGYKFYVNDHHRQIAEALYRVMTGECPRLIINIPPRYQKTMLAVTMWISYCLGWNPKAKFIHLSYSDTLALQNSQEIKDIVTSEQYLQFFDVRIRRDSKAKKLWKTTVGGGVYATAAGGQVTGFGAGEYDPSEYENFIDPDADIIAADIDAGLDFMEDEELYEPPKEFNLIEEFGGAIVIDDPLKPDDAKHETMRESVNERYNNTIRSRTNSRKTPVVVIMQRLDDHDLSAFLEEGGSGEKWETLKLSAIIRNEDGHPVRALYPQKHTLRQLLKMQKTDPYTFDAQYDQEPRARTGGQFKREWLNASIVPMAPPLTANECRGWDFAGTKKTATNRPDWTAHVKIARGVDGLFYVLDAGKFQTTMGNVRKTMKGLAITDGRRCKVRIPQDPGQAGKDQAEGNVSFLAGYPVVVVRPTGPKDVRAEEISVQFEYGNVKIVAGPWNKEFIDDLVAFPSVDDMVDAAADAFNEVALGPVYASGQTPTTGN